MFVVIHKTTNNVHFALVQFLEYIGRVAAQIHQVICVEHIHVGLGFEVHLWWGKSSQMIHWFGFPFS